MATPKKFKATPLGVATHSVENTAVEKQKKSKRNNDYFRDKIAQKLKNHYLLKALQLPQMQVKFFYTFFTQIKVIPTCEKWLFSGGRLQRNLTS